ncbi:hypothetical protein FisN_3Hh064 [Fistulifera solaris]|uniref:Chitin-binding type-4 domain-containing protein n=1 Tax=Fistulifera solaris TaxID=1519565 RepID=A0A1Z5JNM0_FISSO|nr:hypothetical protein FisN_3Hh064 [Fistulifera solaris]|eukprot:GAX15594.1 hypothetical protein FisN_3Hh064 [Fistulifera solaris]
MLVKVLSLVGMLFAPHVEAHGGLISPRSRNRVAREDGSERPGKGVPTPEYCWHCLNDNNGLCGKVGANDYDKWVDSMGIPMPWSSQVTWKPGQVVQIEFEITAHHWGHVELHACPRGRQSTQRCLDQYPLEFVADVSHGMPKDTSFPERGYLTGGKFKYTMQFRLPNDLEGSQVLLQWKYITANSCNPPGYKEYFSGITNPSKSFNSILRTCTLPYPTKGNQAPPEQFWNCAEVSIVGAAPASPPAITSAPVTLPTLISIPVAVPVVAPIPVPVGAPTVAPVIAPVHVPVRAPVIAPVRTTPIEVPVSYPEVEPVPVNLPSSTDSGCCSFNFKTCITNRFWCGTTEQDCLSCESVANWLPSGSLENVNCLPRFSNCNNGTCCPGLVCYERSVWYSQCLPPQDIPLTATDVTTVTELKVDVDESCLASTQRCNVGVCCSGLICKKKKFWHRNPQCVVSDK